MSMTDLTIRPSLDLLPTSEVDRLAALDTVALRSELLGSLRVTAAHLARLAWIVRLLEDRGEDLSELQLGLLDYLRKIAHGQVLPEVVVRYLDSPMLIQRISRLPIPDQQRLAAGEPVKLLVRSTSGEMTFRLLDPLHLTRSQVAQVFDRNQLRSDAGQVAWLEGQALKPKKEQIRKHGCVVADRDNGVLLVGRSKLPPEDVLAALADLRSEETDSPMEESIVVKLTAEEHRRLRIKAAESGVSMTELLRRAIRASGLI